MNAGSKPLIRRFTFDQSFDDDQGFEVGRTSGRKGPTVPDAPPAPPPPPVFNQEDLQAAHEEGYREGRATAQIEAAESNERMSAAALDRIALLLENAGREQVQAREQTIRLAGEIAVGIARKLLPRLAEMHGLNEIETLVRQSLASLLTPAKVMIRVAPDAVAPIRERVETVRDQTGFEGQVTVIGDPNLGIGDAAVDWGDGGASHDTNRIWREIDDAVAAMTARPYQAPPAAAAPTEPVPEPGEPSPAQVRQGPQPKVRRIGDPPQAGEPGA